MIELVSAKIGKINYLSKVCIIKKRSLRCNGTAMGASQFSFCQSACLFYKGFEYLDAGRTLHIPRLTAWQQSSYPENNVIRRKFRATTALPSAPECRFRCHKYSGVMPGYVVSIFVSVRNRPTLSKRFWLRTLQSKTLCLI